MIRVVKETDAVHIAKIYNHYILNTLITFEEQPVTPEELLERIKSITTEYPWLVFEEDGRVVGYAYATRWKERSAYRRTVEAAIYLDVQDIGRHIGSQLTAALLDELRKRKTSQRACRDRFAERRQRGAVREIWFRKGRTARGSRVQVRSMGGRRILGANSRQDWVAVKI